MKSHFILASVIFIGVFASCKKDNSGTAYKTMGSYDTSGLPNYLAPSDTISQSLLEFTDTLLPNGVNLSVSHPELLQGYQNADINITQTSLVTMTFVSETCLATNAFGFYTYPTGQAPTTAADIKQITYIFPNVGPQTPLQPGDKVNLGHFNAGTTIGFVLFVNGWQDPQHTVKNSAPKFYTDDDLNPETDPALQKHAVKIYYAPEGITIIGFEDTNRQAGTGGDSDFNDDVFYYTVTPDP